jgi:uncharacterized membrane protein
MAFCPNCGASVEGRFCAKCGAQVPAGAPAAAPATGPAPGPEQSYAPPPPPQQPQYQQQYGQPQYAAPAASGLQDNVAGALCYLATFITGIIFLVIAPYNQNKFIRFHAFQAIFFAVAWFVFWIALTVVSMVLPWSVSAMLGLVSMLVWLASVGLWILLMVKAYQGQKFKLPVIGDMAEKQA